MGDFLNLILLLFIISLPLVVAIYVMVKVPGWVRPMAFVGLLFVISVEFAIFVPVIQGIPEERVKKSTAPQALAIQRAVIDYQREHGSNRFPDTIEGFVPYLRSGKWGGREFTAPTPEYLLEHFVFYPQNDDLDRSNDVPVIVGKRPHGKRRYVIRAWGSMRWVEYGAFEANMKAAGLRITNQEE